MHWSLTATSSKTTMGHLSLSNRSHISEALHQSQDGFQTECPRGPLQFWPMPDNGKEGAGAGSQSKEIKCSLHFACCGKKNTSSTSSSLDGSSTSASDQQQQHRCHPICHQPQITHTFTYSYILRCNWNVSDNWLASSTAWFKAAAESAAGASHVQKSSRVPMSSNDLTGLDCRDYKD